MLTMSDEAFTCKQDKAKESLHSLEDKRPHNFVVETI